MLHFSLGNNNFTKWNLLWQENVAKNGQNVKCITKLRILNLSYMFNLFYKTHYLPIEQKKRHALFDHLCEY